MKIILRYHGLNAHTIWRELVEGELHRLQDLARIATARVTLEWQRESKPAFRIRAELEVPGPDFHAEARDHTLPAALGKVVRDLERQIRFRKERRADRHNTNVQLGLQPGHSITRVGGCKA